MLSLFNSVLRDAALTPVFQPIVDLHEARIVGYEGLIRGPADSPLHAPTVLFEAARRHGRVGELEILCHRKHIASFARLQLRGKLFLNMSSDVMTADVPEGCMAEPQLVECQEGAGQIVVELTEATGTASYESLRRVAKRYRSRGLQLAIDDLGEGYSSLRLWSELRPEFVKIDKHFVQGIEADAVKRQFVRSMVEMARQSGATLVAEGIETEAELSTVRSLGIACGQGYLLGRPSDTPSHELSPEVDRILKRRLSPAAGNCTRPGMATARKILREVPTVHDTLPTNEVYAIFQKQSELQVLAVLRGGEPLGLIHRSRMLDRLARPYQRELYGAKPCSHFIENAPLIVEQNTSLQDLAHLFTENNPHHLFEGFIITEHGGFIGVGTGFDLLREITQTQMEALRYANPLTQLPGNVPINEHLEMLVQGGESFAVCYADLDHFKPFNDLYGYRHGDEAIQQTAQLLRAHADPELDFLGHIGGDDFILIFRSPDWPQRCQAIVADFPGATRGLYRSEHLSAGGYVATNRQGQELFHQLLSISLGIVQVDGGLPYSSTQIAEMAASAKSQAKKVSGNALFVERRALPESVQ